MARTPTNTPAPLASNLNSLANGAAKVLGKINLNNLDARAATAKIVATLASTGVSSTGTIELYAIMSQDDVDWTDGIDPTSTSDISASLKSAKWLASAPANANSQVVKSVIDLFRLIGHGYSYVCLIAYNKSGAALPASGHDADYQTIVFS